MITTEGNVLGKPHWFRAKTIGWGLVPIRWQGWAYAASWVAAIALPFLLFVVRHQAPEAMAWLTLSVGGLTRNEVEVRGWLLVDACCGT